MSDDSTREAVSAAEFRGEVRSFMANTTARVDGLHAMASANRADIASLRESRAKQTGIVAALAFLIPLFMKFLDYVTGGK